MNIYVLNSKTQNIQVHIDKQNVKIYRLSIILRCSVYFKQENNKLGLYTNKDGDRIKRKLSGDTNCWYR